MKYDKIVSGRFIKRHNRFVGTALVDGVEEKVHIKIPEDVLNFYKREQKYILKTTQRV